MSFRPRLWPTLITLPALVALIALGTWQIQRLQWKGDLIEKLQSRSEAEAVPLPQRIDDLEKFEFQRVTVRGRYLHDQEMPLVNRSLNGNPGLHILTPLERVDGGGTVLVNRGWVPPRGKDPATRPEGQIQGVVAVEGIVKLAKGQGWITPDNEPHNNLWFFVDPAAMAQAAGVESLPPYTVESANTDVPGGFPIGHQWRLDIRNDHLQYAITWYALALGLLVIYVLYHRRVAHEDETRDTA